MLPLPTLPIIIYLRGGGSISKPYGNFSCFYGPQTSLQQTQELPEVVRIAVGGLCPEGYTIIGSVDPTIRQNNLPFYLTFISPKVVYPDEQYCGKGQIIKEETWYAPMQYDAIHLPKSIGFNQFKRHFNKYTFAIKSQQGGDCPEGYKLTRQRATRPEYQGTITYKYWCIKDDIQIRTIYDQWKNNNWP